MLGSITLSMTTKGALCQSNISHIKVNFSKMATVTSNLDKLVAYIRQTLDDLSTPPSDPAYEYASLPQCVIDAVFSIGARYESTENAVKHFCDRVGWQKDGRGRAGREHTIGEFVQIMLPFENLWKDMAVDLFGNQQRTSTTSGILKAEAVYHFAKALQKFGIETFSGVMRSGLREDLRAAIKRIPGQGSGLSYAYFLILAGNQDGVTSPKVLVVTEFTFVPDSEWVTAVYPGIRTT